MSAGQARLRVALAGAGMISYHHLRAWDQVGTAQVVAVCDPDEDRAQARAREFGIPQVYTDPAALFAGAEIDVLDVASPRATHAAWIEAAHARGIHVLCQKPLTPTLSEAEVLAGRLTGPARLMVHENWRFRPWYRQLKEWMLEGRIGQVVGVQMATWSSGMLPDTTGRCPALVRQPFMAHEERLMIAEALIHHLDVVRWLVGRLRVVGARAVRALPEVRGESLATILLETTGGAPVMVTGTMAAPGFPPGTQDRLEIAGSRASAVLDHTELRLLGPEPRHLHYEHAEAYQASFDAAIAHFVECLRTGARFETDLADNLETLRLVEDAYAAAGLPPLLADA